MAKPLYVLLKHTNPDLILREEPDSIDFKALKESLMNSLFLGTSNDHIPCSLFVYEKEGNTLGVLTPNVGTTADP